MRTRKFLLVAFVLSSPVVGMAGQLAPGGPTPVFEVVSVKPNKSGEQGIRLDVQPGGRLTAVNMTLRQLVAATYLNADGKFRNQFDLVGGPPWFNTDRFDIVARAEGMGGLDTNRPAETATPADESAVGRIRVMLGHLFADRFKLVFHHENQEMPIYALVMAKTDRALGPQLRTTDVDCAELYNAGRAGGPPAANQAPCGGFRLLAPGRAVAHAVSMGMLADTMRGWVGRTVVDRTALSGKVDLTLNWTPDQLAQAAPDSGPSIFTAVQEQLGLKLEPARGPVDVIVIDHVELPTPD